MSDTDQCPEKKLFLGGFAGLAAAIIGAIVWAVVTVTTKYQLGLMALGVGALVGFAMRIGNGGKSFSILAALLALFGCLLGSYFSLIAFASAQQHVGFFTMMHDVDPAKVISVMWEDVMSMSIVFYALAAYEAYKFSMVRPADVSPAPESAPQPQTARVGQIDQRTLNERAQ